MNKRKLVETLRRKRTEWESLIAQVGEAEMVESGAAGFWSVKDIIAHVTQYERFLLLNLQALKQNESVPLENPLYDLSQDERNARIYELHREKSLAQVEAEAHENFAYLLTAVKTLKQFEVEKPYLDKTVAEAICGDTFEHYEQHIADIEKWIAKTRSA
jgi:hypothetical protein